MRHGRSSVPGQLPPPLPPLHPDASESSEFSAKKQIKLINEVAINELISRSGVVDLSMLQRIAVAFQAFCKVQQCRSEEHTSELQSLMRTSYAVFCLIKTTYLSTYSLPPH